MKFSDKPTSKQPADADYQTVRGKSEGGDVNISAPARERLGGRAEPLDKAYPWLLGGSLVLSAILCWMYVNKPVVIREGGESAGQTSPHNESDAAGDKVSLVPSSKDLPGNAGKKSVSSPALAKTRAGAALSTYAPGWESTNLKVQHILSVDTGSTELEKIVLNVPVLYETRTMRWDQDDIAKAREIMKRLMLYERNLNKLRNEGRGILKDWNLLLGETAPTMALRADSPTLPYNHSQDEEPGMLPDSSTVIKVER